MGKKISDLAAAAALTGAELVELVQAGANVKALIAALLPPGYIEGLQLKYVGPNSITVTTGSAYVPGLGRLARLTADIALSGLALASNTMHHCYLYEASGSGAVEVVSTTPAAPYNGTARAKTGDASRRYIGSIATDASGNILAFRHSGTQMQYLATTYSGPCLVLAAGTATTPTVVSCAKVVPVSSHCVLLGIYNNDPGVGVVLGTSDMGYTLAGSAAPIFINPNSSALGPIALNDAQELLYQFRSSASSNLGLRVAGYIFLR
jgi:hypothetical protein